MQKPTKVPGKSTPVLQIAYKNNSFGGKVEGRDIFSFAGNKGGFDRLVDAKPGEIYEVTVVKNEAGFLDWTMAVKLEGDNVTAPEPMPQAVPAAASKSSAPFVPKSTYPSDEERAKVQVYIVRQSNITAAIATLAVGAKSLKPEDVIATAKLYEDHVFGTTKDIVVNAKPAKAVKVEVGHEFDDLDDLPQ